MTPSPRKKLIEVALPLEAINKESAREKSIRHGHPSTLHLWWARRPLAACRAVLFASLVDDPSAWPELFPTKEEQETERQRLFAVIEELVLWENSTNKEVLLKAQTEIARSIARNRGDAMPEGAEAIRRYIAENAPPVLDPFCGGGSIPLEAQRLGLEAHGSDLNPVAVLITKALIEIPPKFAGLPPVNPESRKQTHFGNEWEGARGLAEDVRYYGKWMRDEAEKRIGHLYPKVKITEEMAKNRPDLKEYVGEELTVIAWLWARTVKCPNPGCGARTPLVRSFWVSKKKGNPVFLSPVFDDHNQSVSYFEVQTKGKVPEHTTDRTGARCLFCNTFIKKAPLRETATKYGTDSIPLAVVVEGKNGRMYLPSTACKVPAIEKPEDPAFDQPMTNDKRWFSPPLYGLPNFADIFTPRQLVALITFADLVQEAREQVLVDAVAAGGTLPDDKRRLEDGGVGATAYADAVATYLGVGVSRLSDICNSLCMWENTKTQVRHLFTRQAIPMLWDFAEPNIFGEAAGDYWVSLNTISKVIERLHSTSHGYCKQFDAINQRIAKDKLISTDPPYYDNIGYADLSDFFYIWLRQSIGNIYPSIFSTLLTPKSSELIASTYRHGGDKETAQKFFEEGLKKVFEQAHSVELSEPYPLTVYYAFKQAENSQQHEEAQIASTGWDTMLSGLIASGFAISGTWPFWTELKNRPVGTGTNALASSIVLVCRPRPDDAPLATRREFLSALREELPDALRTLQQGNIAPVDLAQSAIGPGMAVFTRYAKVMESDGSAMTVRTALALINQVLDEVLAEQEGDFDGDTRWAISWFEQFGIEAGPYGDAETLSKAKNTAVSGLVEARIIEARGGKVRLLPRDDLPDDWDPATDRRLTVWESTQHLIRALEKDGERGAAVILRKLGAGMGESARDLAYRLYTVCDRMKWAKEALAYNSLIISWPEIASLAHKAEQRARAEKLFFEEEE
jgi:putative DNA methylase